MLDMGFLPAVERIVRACPRSRQTLFFSATLDGEAGTTAKRFTNDAVRHEHGPSARRAAADVEHRFVSIDGVDRLEALVNELGAERDLALVFVRTKRGADRLVKRLGERGVTALAMHGNKSQRQREVALARFESGAVDTLVATDVASRGIDVDGISHVINFDPPDDHDSYVHRIGRTGRAGRTGIGITLVDRHERREVGSLADRLGLEHGLGSATTGGAPAPRARQPQHSAGPRQAGPRQSGTRQAGPRQAGTRQTGARQTGPRQAAEPAGGPPRRRRSRPRPAGRAA
jgi:superfamily II DNA/RNA helicase